MAINADTYDVEGIDNSLTEFIFYSEGVNDTILLYAKFSQVNTVQNIWNLGFGVPQFDVNGILVDVDDLAVIDNGDTDKIFATVTKMALDFMNIFPGRSVYINGSTPARTRKYRQILSLHFKAINQEYQIFTVDVIKKDGIKYFVSRYDFVANSAATRDGFVIVRR